MILRCGPRGYFIDDWFWMLIGLVSAERMLKRFFLSNLPLMISSSGKTVYLMFSCVFFTFNRLLLGFLELLGHQ